jgi:hypothetical protein
MSGKTPKQELLDYLDRSNIPRLSFSRRLPATPEEGKDRSVVWGVKSLREVVQEHDRRLGVGSNGQTAKPAR